ncbi:MAG: cupin domain-containing protein [Cellulosilyticaceae bacterium]
MDINNIDRNALERIVRQVIEDKMGNIAPTCDYIKEKGPGGVSSIKLQTVKVSEADRLDTGKASDIVYTKDLFSLEESPRLGCGMMEMKQTTFDWTLNYDEIDYVIEGHLDIIIDGRKISADSGELILIPKGSKIQFSVPNFARFIYVTYPADWANQN